MPEQLFDEVAAAVAAVVLAPLVCVFVFRKEPNQRATHGVAVLVALGLTASLSGYSEALFSVALFVSAVMGGILSWTYRKLTNAPRSGFARLYAILVGFIAAVTLFAYAFDRGNDTIGLGGILLWVIFTSKFFAFWVYRGFVAPKTP